MHFLKTQMKQKFDKRLGLVWIGLLQKSRGHFVNIKHM